ncbi:MAG TPA: Gfo/Idh/MocA family oxidoreductase [Verrucomicrobiae bacterium]|nr:Gfo/Idh/MocA family oxidoreductase [Verrucomicrobiae bacterium]
MTNYRIGIVGTGFGVSTHLPALTAHPRFEVVALASPSSAARIAKERGIANAFASCQAMLDGCELDAVTIASPPFAHAADVHAALARAKHVVCEKPFALSVADAEGLAEAAARAGTACGIAHEFRFSAPLAALREMIVNRHLDPVRDIEVARYAGNLRGAVQAPRSWWFEAGRGGGIAGGMLVHWIDLANWLAGKPFKRASGLLRTANPARSDNAGPFTSAVDDGAFAAIEYEGGLVARVAADATLAVESFLCAVHGETRTAVASGTSPIGASLHAVDAQETSELECAPSPYAKFASVNPSVPLMMELYDEFVKQIETGASALPTFADGVETQRVMAAIGYPPGR